MAIHHHVTHRYLVTPSSSAISSRHQADGRLVHGNKADASLDLEHPGCDLQRVNPVEWRNKQCCSQSTNGLSFLSSQSQKWFELNLVLVLIQQKCFQLQIKCSTNFQRLVIVCWGNMQSFKIALEWNRYTNMTNCRYYLYW